jgi:hypothetical protein
LSISGARIYDAAAGKPVGTIRLPSQSRAVALAWVDDTTLIVCSENAILVCRVHGYTIDSIETLDDDESMDSGPIVSAVSTSQDTVAVLRIREEQGPTILGDGDPDGFADGIKMHFTLQELRNRGDETVLIPQHSGTMPAVPIGASKPEYRLSPDCLAGVEPLILFYVVLGDNILVATPVDIVRQLQQLRQQKKYDCAMELIRSHPSLLPYHRPTVEEYMTYLVQTRKDFQMAGSVAPYLLQNDIVAWEKWISVFARANQLHHIADKLPCGGPDFLSRATYDLVIKSCLQHGQYDSVEAIVWKWPGKLYNAGAIIHRLQTIHGQCKAMDERQVMRILSGLYEAEGKHRDAFEVLLRAKDHRIFDYVQHRIQDLRVQWLAQHAPDILDVNQKKGLDLLVNCGCPTKDIIVALNESPLILYKYLRQQVQQDESLLDLPEYMTMLLELCAEHDPSNMISLLKSNHSYDIDRVLQVCSDRYPRLIKERIFVLAETGATMEALDTVVQDLDDMREAVAFVDYWSVRGSTGDALWSRLIELVHQDGKMVSRLLEFAGHDVKAAELLQSVSADTVIPQLSSKLSIASKKMQSNSAFLRSCMSNASADCSLLLHRSYKRLRKAVPRVLIEEEGVESNDMFVLEVNQ